MKIQQVDASRVTVLVGGLKAGETFAFRNAIWIRTDRIDPAEYIACVDLGSGECINLDPDIVVQEIDARVVVHK